MGLGLEKVSIESLELNEFVVAAAFNDATFVHDINAVHHFDGGEAMANQHCRLIFDQLAKLLKQFMLSLRIHSAAGFI